MIEMLLGNFPATSSTTSIAPACIEIELHISWTQRLAGIELTQINPSTKSVHYQSNFELPLLYDLGLNEESHRQTIRCTRKKMAI